MSFVSAGAWSLGRISVPILLVFTFAVRARADVRLAVDPFLMAPQTLEKIARPGRGWSRRLTIREGHLTLERLRGETVTARHVFHALEPLAWAEDTEFLIVVHKTGDVYAFDQDLLRRAQFRAKVPAFKVGHVNPDRVMSAHFVTENLWREPLVPYAPEAIYPADRRRDHLWDAGRLIILKEAGGRLETAAELDRGVMSSYVSSAELVLADLARTLDPTVPLEDVKGVVPWALARVVLELPPDLLARLTPNAAKLIARSRMQRDRFRLEGERDVRPEIVIRDEARRVLSPNRLNRLALAAGAVAGTAAVAQGLDAAGISAVHETFALWAATLTPALMNESYRSVALKSFASLSMVLPATWMVGAASSRLAGGDGHGSRALLRFGSAVLAKVNTPVWHLAAQLARQPHAVDAWALGLHPRQVVTPDSPLGRLAKLDAPARAGWVDPLGRRPEDARRTERLVEAMGRRRREAGAFATWLARLIVAEDEGVDPATLALAAEEGAGVGTRLARESALRERWRELLLEMLSDRGDEAAPLDPEELRTAVERARRLARDVLARAAPDGYRERLAVEYALARDRVPDFMRRFAVLENEYFATAQPTDQIATENWRRAIFEYYWGLGQTLFFAGPRSDFTNPGALAAQPDAFLYSNPAFRYDAWDAIRTRVFIDGPALMQIHQQENAPADPAYRPRENEWLKPNFAPIDPVAGARFWASKLADLREGGYGHIWKARLWQSIAMLQTTAAMTIGSRMLFADADFASSAGAYVVFFAVGPWLVGPFTDPVISTNTRTAAHFEAVRARTRAALNQVARGVRVRDRADWAAGVAALKVLTNAPGAKLEDDVRAFLERDPATWDEDEAVRVAEKLGRAPPLPGIGPEFLPGLASFGTIVYMTWAGNLLSVVTFDPTTNWPLLLTGAVAGSASLYLASARAQASIDRTPCAAELAR